MLRHITEIVYRYNELLINDIVEKSTLLEYYNVTHSNFIKIADKCTILSKKYDKLKTKYVEEKAKCNELNNQITTNYKIHNDTLATNTSVLLTNQNALVSHISKADNPEPKVTSNVQIQQIYMGDNYNYITKNFPNAPTIEHFTLNTLQKWYLDILVRPQIKNVANADYIECLGILKCNKQCTPGKVYCMTNHVLEKTLIDKFDDSKCNKKTKDTATKTITRHNNCPSGINYAKFLGSIVVDCYKKENSSDQSLWNTDTTRCSYIVKYIRNNISKWEQDKKGAKTQLQIVDPLIMCICKILENYNTYICKESKDNIKEYINYTQNKRTTQLKMVRNKSTKNSSDNHDIKIKYNFENYNNADYINELIYSEDKNLDMLLTGITNSCHDYNRLHHDDKAEYYIRNQTETLNRSLKIVKIKEHICNKEFGMMIIRGIASHFFLDKNIKSNSKMIEDKPGITVTEVD